MMLLNYLLCPGRGADYCDSCLSVCLSACIHVSTLCNECWGGVCDALLPRPCSVGLDPNKISVLMVLSDVDLMKMSVKNYIFQMRVWGSAVSSSELY